MLPLRTSPHWRRAVALLPIVAIVALWSVGGAALAQTTVGVVCPHRFTLSAGEQPLRVAYCARQPIDVPDGAARQVVVVIHGEHRNATSNYRSVEQAAASAGANALIVTAQFPTDQDARTHGLAGDMPIWTDNGWKQGDQSRTTAALPASAAVSSFTVVDELVRRLADRALFPNVEQIVVAGHSAGGQFVHRYAAASQVEDTLRPLGIRVRYVVGSPSSYLYFDARRPLPGQASELAVPSEAAIAECPRYNDYRYGLEDLNRYARAVGAEGLKAQYASRNVVFLLGGRDNDPSADDLDHGCAANLQGAERLERGNQFYTALGHQFGPDIYARQVKAIIPDAVHSPTQVFNSPAGRAYLFERDPSPPTPSR